MIASVFFGSSRIFDRKGLMHADFFISTLYSFLVAPPILLCFSVVHGDLFLPYNYDLHSLLFIALAGILGNIIGRTFLFASIKTIGATRAGVFAATQIIFVSTLGIIFLGENMNLKMGVGTLLAFLGLIFTSISSPTAKGAIAIFHEKFKTGCFFGIVCGFSGAASLIFAKEAITRIGSSIMVTLISTSFSVLAILLIVLKTLPKRSLRLKKEPTAYIFFGGVLKTLGALSLYTALGLAPAVFVAPIMTINPLVTLFLSHIVIQKIELINKRTVLGAFIGVFGVLLVVT